MTGMTIKGTGRYLPETIVENQAFTAFLDTSDEWIRSHTGIERRRIAIDEPTWYMGAKAAEQAIAAAGITVQEIDVIIGTTITPDFHFPSMACMVQEVIGAERAFAYDISAACAGFPFALDMAQRYLAAGDVRYVLIISAERLSQVVDYADRGTCILFGDGAAAAVISAGTGQFAAHLGGDASGTKHLYASYVEHETPFSAESQKRMLSRFEDERPGYTVMHGNDVYRFATKMMPEAIEKACAKLGLTPNKLDLIVPHQANMRIIKTAAKNLGLPMERFYVNIQDFGNTSSASIGIALDECVRNGRLKRGDLVCVVGFGAGLVYGAAVFSY